MSSVCDYCIISVLLATLNFFLYQFVAIPEQIFNEHSSKLHTQCQVSNCLTNYARTIALHLVAILTIQLAG